MHFAERAKRETEFSDSIAIGGIDSPLFLLGGDTHEIPASVFPPLLLHAL